MQANLRGYETTFPFLIVGGGGELREVLTARVG